MNGFLRKYGNLTGLVVLALVSIQPLRAQQADVQVVPHQTGVCNGSFVAQPLDHTTRVNADPVSMFESNGSGLAVNDLDNDGLLDIVLGNLDGPDSIFWNEGGLAFRKEVLDVPGRTRAINIVDVDGDGWLDIIRTTQLSAPSYWRNQGNGEFVFSPLRGVSKPAYAMNWGDIDNDGDLDLVTGSYDAELERILSNDFMLGGGAGVYLYTNEGDGSFTDTRLADRSQALTILLADIEADGQLEIGVGNDFALADQFWRNVDGMWTPFTPFTTITHSTMSFDAADIDNNGVLEVYAADMHPYTDDAETQAAWAPIMDDMMAMPMPEGDPQIMANVLQMPAGGGYSNLATAVGLDATGWSWSAKFGDLDSDGFLDLYVVNGMIAADLFGHLPGNELVEENQAFRNVGGAAFVPQPEWGLGVTDSGRGMTMADLDNDGDLDIVVNNLLTPALIFENRICGGDNLTIDLRQTEAANHFALGSRVVLHTTSGVYQRDVHAASGYLSGDPARIHFGLPSGTIIELIEVYWRDGGATRFSEIAPDTWLTITR